MRPRRHPSAIASASIPVSVSWSRRRASSASLTRSIIEAATTTNLDADIYAYSLAEGAFVGATLEGAVIRRRDDWNYYYYGDGANANSIVLDQRFKNPHADELRGALALF